MNNKNNTIIILLILLIVIVGFTVFNPKKAGTGTHVAVTNFEECAKAGYPVMESYPAQCRDASGHLFVQMVVQEPVPPVPVQSSSVFGTEYTISQQTSLTFPDGLTVMLKDVDDSRCMPGVQCIWAGELTLYFSVKGGAFGTAEEEIHLATMTAKKLTVKGYTFTLKNVTENSATITITK